MIIELGTMTAETKQPGILRKDNPAAQKGNLPL